MRLIDEHRRALDVEDHIHRGSLEFEHEGTSRCRTVYSCCGGCEDRTFWLPVEEVRKLAEHLNSLLEDL